MKKCQCFYIVAFTLFAFIQVANAQAHKNSFGANIGYGGGDGTDPSVTFDVFYARRLSSVFQIRIGYYNGDSKRNLEDFRFQPKEIQEFLSSQWFSAQNTSENPNIVHTSIRIFSIGTNIKINSFGKSSLHVMPSINYFIHTGEYLSSSGSSFQYIGFSSYHDYGINVGLDIMYRYKINNFLAINTSAYMIFGSFQVGGKIGFETDF
ncbi:MAG: hypothetical protein H6567_13420 [Lewinellaceae bacterium]|nr:hypothetical protein [Lewinellaceae bacterium]